MYFITGGDRVGGFVVNIAEHDSPGAYAFLFMPSPTEALYINKNEVHDAIKSKLFVKADKLPKEVYDVLAANWRVYAEEQGII